MREYMRKLLMAGLISVMVLAFAGCAGSGNQQSTETTAATTAEPTTEATEQVSVAAAENYDVMKDSKLVESGSELLLYGNDFVLHMPNNDKWGYEKDSAGNLDIYLKAARDGGSGGNLVTIMAFDPTDTSYEDFPDYSVAGTGKNVNKKFIALFPTDVQFDSKNTEQEADYNELSAHVKKIAEGKADSPFQIKDSDAE